MKADAMRVIGFILLIVGILMLTVKGLNWTTEKEVLDVGPVEVNKQEERRLDWPAYAGGIVAVAGVVLIIAGSRKKR